MERAGSAQTLPLVAVAALLVFAIGLTGGLLTQPSDWSAALQRPSWHPPAWVFAVAWAAVAISATFGLAAAWEALPRAQDRTAFLTLMTANAFFNVAWNALFFILRRPDLALLDIAALWFSIAAVIALLARQGAAKAALLMAPYLVWISIATALNFEIVRLNAPF